MKTTRLTLLPLAALLVFSACKKDKDKEPSKTDLLTGSTWKDSSEFLQLNSSTGTRTPAASDINTYQFSRDGKVTVTPASGRPETGTWSFANNETQLTITNGTDTGTYDLIELSKDKFSYGFRYNQTQIQTALGGGGGTQGQLLVLILLSANNFTFPGGTPTTPASQLTSVQWGTTAVPR
jgi:hypothetical protein